MSINWTALGLVLGAVFLHRLVGWFFAPVAFLIVAVGTAFAVCFVPGYQVGPHNEVLMIFATAICVLWLLFGRPSRGFQQVIPPDHGAGGQGGQIRPGSLGEGGIGQQDLSR